MRITGVLHASVNTSSAADDTAAFYAEVLGLPRRDRPEIPGIPGQWFDVGDVQLHLVGAPEADHGIDPVTHHVCFAVEDLDAAMDELAERGIPVVTGAQGDVVQVWFTDPAGNTIELQQDRT
jgi:catechol 2,3-dioxygenase-like lactoylglutathione lyase family enzyme